jgi:EpsI family protein
MFRYLALPVILGVLLGSVYILPKRGKVAESAVRMDLPSTLGEWRGKKVPVSQQELDILAKDTEFAKADYYRSRSVLPLPGGYRDFDRINVSVVLSGYDINNSIHRPERCLPAQGHTIYSSASRVIDLPNGRKLPVRCLKTKQRIRLNPDSDEIAVVDSLLYYFFVGHDRVTNDHYKRTFIDMRDRLFKGRDQRWAYVTLATTTGKVPWSPRTVSQKEAEAMLDKFCKQLAVKIIDWDQVKK